MTAMNVGGWRVTFVLLILIPTLHFGKLPRPWRLPHPRRQTRRLCRKGSLYRSQIHSKACARSEARGEVVASRERSVLVAATGERVVSELKTEGMAAETASGQMRIGAKRLKRPTAIRCNGQTSRYFKRKVDRSLSLSLQ